MTHKERRLSDLLYALGALAFLAGALWVVLTLQGLRADLQTQYTARDALARQVEHLGGDPVSGPPGSRGEPGRSVTGPKGPKGDEGEQGNPGPTGPSGKSGKNGDDGSNGVGQTGASGEAGQDGAAGQEGAAGQPGPQGEPGPAGPQGEPGTDGADGKDGSDGQTCPSGYSLQPPPDDPDALVCRRDGAPQPEQNQGNDSQSLGALDPQRRQYP
ncbi:collagen-like protein [Streptomyces sp. BH097]|uniref:collagen-like protein n=1 Tax=unclassified Streptomyces TaxID=2593676 RepID=UPI003BB6DFB3